MFAAAGIISTRAQPLPPRPETWVNANYVHRLINDGVTDTTDEFEAIRNEGRAHSGTYKLWIQPGKYVVVMATDFSSLFDGIAVPRVWAYGAELPAVPISTAYGISTVAAGHQAYCNAITVGDSQLTCKTPSDAGIFSVGDWCLIGACEWQGASGFPPNHHYLQHVKVTSSNAGTGIVGFTPPAKQNYSDLFPPTKNPGDPYDPGGPVAIFKYVLRPLITDAPLPSWDTQLSIFGMGMLNIHGGVPAAQITCTGRCIRLVDCHFYGTGPTPTVSQSFLYLRGRSDFFIEIDKECEHIEFRDTRIRSMIIQSSSVTQFVFNNSTIDLFLHGSPRRMEIKGASVIPEFTPGVSGYGYTEELNIRSPAVINSFSPNLFMKQPVTGFSDVAGVLTWNNGGLFSMAPPRAKLIISGNVRFFGNSSTFVRSMTASGGKPVLDTSFPDPLPTPTVLGSIFYVNQMPVGSVVVESGVTGCPEILDHATAPAGSPLFSHVLNTYTGDPAEQRASNVLKCWGALRASGYEIRINVSQAYTGINGTCLFTLSGEFKALDGTSITKNWIINAKVTGQRVITSASITGAQSGDTLGTAPGEIVLVEGFVGSFADDLTGESLAVRPILQVEATLDQ